VDVYRKRTSRLPPGPPGLPLLGKLLDLPSKFLHAKLGTWSKQYGPLYTIWIMSQPFVILGNVTVAAEVLDRISAATSDRPPMIKAREFYFKDMIIMLLDHTPRCVSSAFSTEKSHIRNENTGGALSASQFTPTLISDLQHGSTRCKPTRPRASLLVSYSTRRNACLIMPTDSRALSSSALSMVARAFLSPAGPKQTYRGPDRRRDARGHAAAQHRRCTAIS